MDRIMAGRSFSMPVILGIIILGAGCLNAPPDDTKAETPVDPAAILATYDAALVSGDGHDHSAFGQHAGTGWDLREVYRGSLPLDSDWPPERRALGQLQVVGDLAFVSLTLAGFVILDVSDPAAPEQLGVFDGGRALLNDVEVTDDLRWAFVPSDRLPANVAAADPTATDPTDLFADPMPGVLIVDLSDLSAPRLAGHYQSLDSFGYHRLDLHEIDGSTYVFAATYSRALKHPVGCRLDILEFEEVVSGPRLTKVGSYSSQVPEHIMMCADPDTFDSAGAHDVVVVPDPLEDFPLAVVSMWAAGVHLLDVSDPTAPRLLGYWDELPFYNGPERTDAARGQGNAHEAQVTAVDGRRIVAISQELAWAKRQGIMWLVDFTTPTLPVLVSDWEIPGDHPHWDHDADAMAMSGHGPKIFDQRIWLTHHHAGLVVLNVTTMDQVRAPTPEAWLIPPPVEDRAWFGPWRATPMVYDVVVRGQDIFISDLTSGFRVAEWAPGSGPWSQAQGTTS